MRTTVIAALLAFLAAAGAAAQSLQERVPVCLACHGEKGQSENQNVPSLGAQTAPYSLIQLYLFRERQRVAEPMNDMTKGLSDDDLRTLSDMIARLPPPQPAETAGDAARIAGAQALVQQHRCNFCHAPNLAGQDNVPRIAGQREEYLQATLRGFKSGERPGYTMAMGGAVSQVTPEELDTLAYYAAHFPGTASAPGK